MAAGEDDLQEDGGLVRDAAVRECGVGAGQVERAQPVRPEPDRLDRLEPRLDPHPVGELGDRLRAEVERESGEDRVVGEEGRLCDRDPAGVRVLERLDVPVAGPQEGGGEVRRRSRVDLPLNRLREDEHLERRARLPLAVCRDVERDLLTGLGDRHRADLACRRVDRNDRAGRVALAVERAEDRVRRLGLLLGVEGRVDAQAAAPHPLRAVLVDELGSDVVGEIGLARPRQAVRMEPERAAQRPPVEG